MNDQPDVLGAYSLEVVRDLLQRWADLNLQAQQVQEAIPPSLLDGLLTTGNVWQTLTLPLVAVPSGELRFAYEVLSDAVGAIDRHLAGRLSPPERMIVSGRDDTRRGADGVNEEDEARMAALEDEVEELRELVRAHDLVCPSSPRFVGALPPRL